MLILWFVGILSLLVILYLVSFLNATDSNRTEKKQELLKKLDTPKEKNRKRRKQVNKVVLPERKSVVNTIGDIDPFEEAAPAANNSVKKEAEKPATKTSKKQSKKQKKAAKAAAAAAQKKQEEKTSNKKKGKKAAAPAVSYAEVAEKAAVKEEAKKKKANKKNAKANNSSKKEEEKLVGNLHSNDVMTTIAPTETLSKDDNQGFITVTDKKHKAAVASKQNNVTTDGWNIVGAPAENSKPTTSTTPAATSNKRRNNKPFKSGLPQKSSNLNYKPYANEADFWSSEPAPLAAESSTENTGATADETAEDTQQMPNIDLLRNTLPSKQSAVVIKMYSGIQTPQGQAWNQVDAPSQNGSLDSQEFPTFDEASSMPAPKKKRTQQHQEPTQDLEIESPEVEPLES
uniref:Uncharacterized protein n=1 Tax=Percolomonas cosmopolitus TaxID=63605 RepID=A0A7S1PHS3_9EUKA|mmetsp:Transcript_621/g.2201  ORF Transcript_621/g.2201 Transcript_621/m.2201 type:complete len:401 (+) Transcript_621:184-1386(+)|eukprot:CAMPEP_0117444150 /NCGR_PEP_ID=MMETSP0759-20121206/5080_1 /TAXON_ID=63605 /ORGANISM="Percolomonas cosmopolitus, Strain WS" /LENGTH=400 /DNA_ID=CAMNT_0005236183 /DNA_START=269 /DNA_END=1471 /DNA_ORIENTATION=+